MVAGTAREDALARQLTGFAALRCSRGARRADPVEWRPDRGAIYRRSEDRERGRDRHRRTRDRRMVAARPGAGPVAPGTRLDEVQHGADARAARRGDPAGDRPSGKRVAAADAGLGGHRDRRGDTDRERRERRSRDRSARRGRRCRERHSGPDVAVDRRLRAGARHRRARPGLAVGRATRAGGRAVRARRRARRSLRRPRSVRDRAVHHDRAAHRDRDLRARRRDVARAAASARADAAARQRITGRRAGAPAGARGAGDPRRARAAPAVGRADRPVRPRIRPRDPGGVQHGGSDRADLVDRGGADPHRRAAPQRRVRRA